MYNEGPGGGLACWLCCGKSCLEKTGVPAVVEGELSDRILSSKFPPLPELTVMCGGRRGFNEASEAISIVEGSPNIYPKRPVATTLSQRCRPQRE